MKSYEQYVDEANRERLNGRFLTALAIFIVAGGFGFLLGSAIGSDLAKVVLALLAGAFAVAAWLAETIQDVTPIAEERFVVDWAAEHGLAYSKKGGGPSESPFASGKQSVFVGRSFSGQLQGHETMIYLGAYTLETLRFFTFIGARVPPITGFTIASRGGLDKSVSLDAVQAAVSAERPVRLESSAFNSRFDLTVDKTEDVRKALRVFDPAAITALLSIEEHVPRITCRNGAWWVTETGDFHVKRLDRCLERQAVAVRAIAILMKGAS